MRPVLYAGGGCNSNEAAKGIARLREVMSMPVVTSLMGIGAVPAGTNEPDSFGSLGMVGMHGSIAANRAMHESDVVLAVGVRFDDRATGLIKKFCPEAKIIHIDIDAAEVNKIMPSFLSIIGDAESALPALAEFLAAELRKESSEDRHGAGSMVGRAGERARWSERLEALKAEETARNRERGAEHPGAFIASVPERAREAGFDPDNILVTTDVGQHQMWAAQSYPVKFPRQFMTSGSLGTMGFGLPVAIGAALANPGKRVVCISGDGSIMMNIQELATLAEQNLDVTVIVLDNGGLGMVRQQQTFLFAKNYSACDYAASPDLLKIAEGFGIRAVDAAEPGWEQSAFGKAGPCLVRKAISPSENVFPFVPAGKANVEAITGA